MSCSAAIVLAAGLSIGLESTAGAAALYSKIGTHVSHSYVFANIGSDRMVCFGPALGVEDAEVCYRANRNATYVQSKRASGYFKLGQHASAGNTWRCRNNFTNSSGTGTWVECKWNTKPSTGGCAVLRVGHGQSDWYVVSNGSQLTCLW